MKEGWALDITSRGKVHYYKDEVSLCKKRILKSFMKIHGNHLGSKWCGDCAMCCKKQRE